jgi:hypothetical protein
MRMDFPCQPTNEKRRPADDQAALRNTLAKI